MTSILDARSSAPVLLSCVVSAVGLRLLGLPWILVALIQCAGFLLLSLDRLLGRLAGWAIGRTPKKFQWTIDLICVRPSFSWKPHAWSEITIHGWTWHNPPEFPKDTSNEMPDCILQIDRLTLRVELASVYHALRHRQAVNIDLLLLEGVKFRTQRNEQAALNLWEALDLPDADVNVSSIVTHAKKHGGMRSLDSGRAIKPLPVVATQATRMAKMRAKMRSQKGKDETLETTHVSGRPSRCIPCGVASRGKDIVSKASERSEAREYFEYPIGDPRRRPRWGVPIRFDIRQIAALHVDLWILDLLTMDKHWRRIEAGDTKMTVSSLFVSREILEAGDLRRSGSGEKGDGVHGVYLGELVWALIGNLLPKVVKKSPSNFLKTAALAAVYALKDSASIARAKVIDCAMDAKWRCFKKQPLPERGCSETYCTLEVRLIMGRGITHEGQRVNVHALLELRDPPDNRSMSQNQMGQLVAKAESARRTRTKSPWWDETFILCPVRFDESVLRIVLFWHSDPLLGTGFPLGEVTVPISELLVEDSAIDDAICGWFPLERLCAGSSGRIKLCVRVMGRRFLINSRVRRGSSDQLQLGSRPGSR